MATLSNTAAWVATLNNALHAKLAAVGLIEPRGSAKLAAFIDTYIENQQVKASTKLTYRRAQNHLVGFFGSDRDLRAISPGDADDWWAWMLGKRKRRLAENTARKSVSIARQIVKAARRRKLIGADPFAHLSGTVRPNRSRDYLVSREDIAAVLAACPDAEWRLLVALARFGGLRIPSEAQRLRWGDVDWANGRFTVHAKKTEHHDNGGIRIVPIFPELLPHLQEAFDQAEEGSEFVLVRYGHDGANVNTHFRRIIERAGLKP